MEIKRKTMIKGTYMKRPLLTLLLFAACALTIISCGNCGSGCRHQAKTICYVPIDDRPVNCERVEYLCAAVGFDLLMPEKELTGTRLDNMEPFEGGRTCGDRQALFEWLKACEGKCDYYVLSLDQLLSGGLVSSRWLAGEDISFEQQVCDYVRNLSLRYPVILFDTVMRFASTVGYGGYDYTQYNALREYGMKPRKVLQGADLSPENIVAAYGISPSGQSIAHPGLNEEQLQRYFASRRRKLLLAQSILQGQSNFDWVFLGVDDTAPGNNIQSNELEYLGTLLGPNGCIGTACDDLGLMSIARVALQEYGPVQVDIRYFGGKQMENADSYNYLSLEEDIAQKFKFMGLQYADAPREDCLTVLVLTRAESPQAYDNARAELLATARDMLDAGLPLCVVDANSGEPHYNPATMLGKELIDSGIPLLELLGFSCWNTASNAVGIGFSTSAARYAYLRAGRPSRSSNRAFVQSMAFCYLKDISYKYCGFRADRFDSTAPYSYNYVLERLNASPVATSFSPLRTAPHGPVSVSNFRYPWNRTFEALFDVNVD